MDEKDRKESCPFGEKIETAITLSQQNNLQLEKLLNQWYTNKDLFEMIENLKEDMTEFNKNFHKYNGLVEKQQKLKKALHKKKELAEKNKKEIDKMKQKKQTKSSVYKNWRLWVAWIISILLGISNLYLVFS